MSQLAAAPRRVLVCTDCLSEGINLQDHFDAVFHYDLSWNPTRHEQREGRVDRYGQPSPKVRALTYYGTDNQIDGIVLDVLLRKHRCLFGSWHGDERQDEDHLESLYRSRLYTSS